MIEIKNLTLQRGTKVLLNQATATINPRQRVGLIGKNGAGKSSLFALIKGELSRWRGLCYSQIMEISGCCARNTSVRYFCTGLCLARRH